MKYQRGFTLSRVIVWSIIIVLVALLGIKVVPEVATFYRIKKIVVATANNAEGRTVPEIRRIYDRYANVDGITTLEPADLDIYKEGSSVVVAFAYEKRIPLFLNVSLLLEFKGESRQP